jgi:nucleoprotein TPR
MSATTWDTGYMAAYLNVPQNTLDTIIDTPTADLVKAVLDAVAAKAHEHEEAQADNIRLEVELENVVRSSQGRQ